MTKLWLARNDNGTLWLHIDKPEFDNETGNWISHSPMKTQLYTESYSEIAKKQCIPFISLNQPTPPGFKFKIGDTIKPRKGWDRKWISGWPDTIVMIDKDYMWFTDRSKVHVVFASDFEKVEE